MGQDGKAGRGDVVAEARGWKRTPYRNRGRTLGEAVDCAWILIKTYAAVGLIEEFDPGPYASDWYLHRSEELFLGHVERYAREIDPAQAREGDAIIFKVGRCHAHGGIITGDPDRPKILGLPWIVHANQDAGVVEEVDIRLSPLTMLKDGSPRPFKTFTFWEA